MKRRTLVHLSGVIAIIAGVAAGVPGQARAAMPQETESPQDVPVPIVAGGVSYYDVATPKLFWADLPDPCPPTLAAAEGAAEGAAAPGGVPAGTFAEGVMAAPASVDAFAGIYDESINRISVYGSEARALLSRSNAFCGQGTVLSNIDADCQLHLLHQQRRPGAPFGECQPGRRA